MRLLPGHELLDNSVVIEENLLDFVEEKIESISLQKALIKERAGPNHIARVISDVLHNGVSDSVRLKAADMAAEMGGYKKVAQEASTIQINIHGDNVQLNSLFCPQR
jgi:hypothetical protein